MLISFPVIIQNHPVDLPTSQRGLFIKVKLPLLIVNSSPKGSCRCNEVESFCDFSIKTAKLFRAYAKVFTRLGLTLSPPLQKFGVIGPVRTCKDSICNRKLPSLQLCECRQGSECNSMGFLPCKFVSAIGIHR